jgi:GT2 family glycosyltransferase
LLFPAGDVDGLADVLARLMREPDLHRSLRAGITPPRSIEDDVRFARGLYDDQVTGKPRRTERSASTADSPRSSVDLNRIAAVVLNFRTPEQTLLTVKSLLASRRAIDELIVVNNDTDDSDAETRGTLRDVWSKITYVHTGSNLGFSGGMNAGIRRALARGASSVLLVNSDVIVPPDTIAKLEQCIAADGRVGIAGPVVLARSEPSQVASLGMSYAPRTGRMRHRGNGDRVTSGERIADDIRVDGVSGCLMLIRKEVFDVIGMLDEDYFFSFEDLDFCLRAERVGFATVLAGGATVYHEGGRSLGARSPKRFYFAARNHLLLASRAGGSAMPLASACRAFAIVMLNLTHAVVSPGGSVTARVADAARGTRDYLGERFGAGR